ncbi:MAG: 4-alpha-glucanotransferase [Candidatus Margulisiibacteriota bacterium]|nr:MAG: 4-alpha-glucanotransferase [Candidatus Margulisbacteria bacterium GWD2_39_127]PZM83532.1 MAG: 4-alpha-glucanotransferase [Candidatus Margulisiibacteriota bacterium]HAR64290.1 4-alpha-glucanotransferase [Candidatus Margulisiibacteriota bacterium]HCY37139.1 4-alpha-glucanotransferase [Candidatus Margulisiibacteriota bacterium]
MNKRGSGLLMHVTSLPSPFGIGDMGPGAYKFIDFLIHTKQSYWQVLPLNPTLVVLGNSPYSSISAFAGNTLLISPELLVDEGYLDVSDIGKMPVFPEGKVDYESVTQYKQFLFNQAHMKFKVKEERYGYIHFCQKNNDWLEDYALFSVLKNHFQGSLWCDWPVEIRDRHDGALNHMRSLLNEEIEKEKFLQYIFYKQWSAVKCHCNLNGIQIIGDIPIYVNYDSSDVWAHPYLFKLNYDKRPVAVSGVPPDYFSSTGQLWGNPVYEWDALRYQRYHWWIQRIRHNLGLYNIIRIDHFRGLVAYWEVPFGERTAINGRWADVPSVDFFTVLYKFFPYFPIIAEDLGTITPDVREVMRQFGIPGMQVLLFAFGEDNPVHPYLPHNYVKNSMVYTGTHDNNTAKGWFRQEASHDDKRRLFRYIGKEVSEDEASWELMRLALSSGSNVAMVPVQDILSLGEEARMNIPATTNGNWLWRLLPDQLNSYVRDRLAEMTYIYGRA